MVVRDDVAVRADDHAGTAALLLPGRTVAETKEIPQERVDVIILFVADCHFDKNHGIHCRFGSIGKIGILGLIQVDGPVHRTVGNDGRRIRRRAVCIGCPHHAVGRQCAQRHRQHNYGNTSFHFIICYELSLQAFRCSFLLHLHQSLQPGPVGRESIFPRSLRTRPTDSGC